MTLGVANPALDAIAERHRGTATEEALFRGYSRTPEPEPRIRGCACGGDIVARSLADRDVATAVLAHNVTPAHAAWRERAGID